MNYSPKPPTNPCRVTELVERFRVIGETAMRDLPLFNGQLEVEAVGFRPYANAWMGVLITPWFMNLIRLPDKLIPMNMDRVGHKERLVLPAGERELVVGGDEVIGAYEALSLHSPMYAFENQEQARHEAQRSLENFFQPAEDPVTAENGRLWADPPKVSRRAFLRGGRSESDAT